MLHALQFSNVYDWHLDSLETCQTVSGVVPAQEQHSHQRLMEKAQKLFLPDRGGSSRMWDRRPLHPTLWDYAAAGVKFLLAMKQRWESSDIDKAVMDIGQGRVRQAVCGPHPPHGPDMAKRDFPLFDVVALQVLGDADRDSNGKVTPQYTLRPCPSYSGRRDRINLGPNLIQYQM